MTHDAVWTGKLANSKFYQFNGVIFQKT